MVLRGTVDIYNPHILKTFIESFVSTQTYVCKYL